jgi:hypothetical protein
MRKQLRVLAFVGTLVGTLALEAAAASADVEPKGLSRLFPAPLEGAWRVRITPYVCSTGESLSQATVDSYLTFAAGGTLAEGTSNPAFQPGQRGAGHGYWERTSRNEYTAVVEAFIQFTSVTTAPTPPRYVRGVQRIEQEIEMLDGDRWESVATVTFRDAAGAVVPPSGCATAKATRMP